MSLPDPFVAQRLRWIRSVHDLGGRGLEIGPSYNPTVARSEGVQVEYLDHASQEELRAKYAAHGVAVDLDRIPVVDHVWRGEPYAELVGPRRYSWIVACHVLEHTPDLIRFLADCEAILEPGGVLLLVLPDMRYCFDTLRFPTNLAEVTQAHALGATRHDGAVLYEAHVTAAALDGTHAWDHARAGALRPIHTPDQARQMAAEADAHEDYVDAHRWVFTPHSVRGLVEDLHDLGRTRLREVGFHPTAFSEFFLALALDGPGPGCSRFELAEETRRELVESYRTLGSPLRAFTNRVRAALRRRLGGA